MRWFWFGLGYVAAHTIAGRLLTGHPIALGWFGTLAMLLPPALLVSVIARRRRNWAGCQWLFWSVVGLGSILWSIGHIGWSIDALVLAQDYPWLAWHTLFSLGGGAAFFVAILARPHRGCRETTSHTVAIDLAGAAILLLFLLSYFVLVPSFVPELVDQARRTLLVSAQALRLALLVGLVVLAMRTREQPWSTTYGRLAGAVGIGFALRGATSLAIMRNAYAVGTAYDLAWIVPYLGYAWAAANAPASRGAAVDDTVDATVSPPWLSFAALALVPIVGYGMRIAFPFGAPADGFRDVLTAVSVLAVLGVLTARAGVQRALLRQAGARVRLLAAAMQQTGDVILIVRKGGTIEEANDACCRALGYAREELVGRHVEVLLGPDSVGLGDRIAATLATGRVWRGTIQRRCKDGRTFPAAGTVVPLVSGEGRVTHYVGVERDVTEDLQLQDRLVQSERLSAIGELAAGVAHEINNPLQTILGRAELLRGDRELSPARRADVEAVQEEATRVAQIVRNLLSFVRRSSVDRAPIDLNEIVRGLVRLRTYPARQDNVAIDTHLPDEPLVVQANRNGIQQVLTNLLLNAEHAARALPGQGTVTVRAWGDADGVHVEVADDGPGVSPEIRGRIFEPFFTTRPVGEGTGLGLSTALGIARGHDGRLELVPSVRGACFRLTLPKPEAEIE